MGAKSLTSLVVKPGIGSTSPSGGSSITVTPVTIAEMQALIVAGTVLNVLYKITDLADEGAYFQGTVANKLNSNGFGYWWIADYSQYTQLLSTDTVTIGEKWIWGNQVWESTTGNNPPALNNYDLEPADWTLVAKSATDYVLKEFEISWDAVTNFINQMKQPDSVNLATIVPIEVSLFSRNINIQWSSGTEKNQGNRATINNRIGTNGVFALNYAKGDSPTAAYKENDIDGVFLANSSSNAQFRNNVMTGGSLSGNINSDGKINDNSIADNASIDANNVGVSAEISENTLTDDSLINKCNLIGATISNNTLSNTSQITNMLLGNAATCNENIVSAATSPFGTVPQIGFCVQNDNSTINQNTVSGAGACIWDVVQVENCQVNGNTLSGDGVSAVTNDICLIADIKQLSSDKINNCILSATDTRIQAIVQEGFSEIDTIILDEEGARVEAITMKGLQAAQTQFKNCTITNGSGKTGFKNLSIINSVIENATDINIQNCNFEGCNFDLTGLNNVDIENASYVNGKGIITISIDFGNTPVIAGQRRQFGFIPNGAFATKMSLLSSTVATPAVEFSIGIAFNNSYLIPSTVGSLIVPTTVNTLSATATSGNGGIIIDASSSLNNVDGGIIDLQVEFQY